MLVGMKFSNFAEVPIISLGPLGDGERGLQAVAAEIRAACETVGFFYVKDHGLDPALVDRLLGHARRFFALPLERKMDVAIMRSAGYRGYLPIGYIGSDDKIRGNLQEAFQIYSPLLEVRDGTVGDVLAAPNQWPEGMPDLRRDMLDYFQRISELALRLVSAFGVGLGMAPGHFSQFYRKPIMQLRLLHYPPQAPDGDPSGGPIGTRPHTDSGVVTVLHQDDTGGLEVLNSAGDWVPVPPIPGTYVINIGDMMKYWTNGRFASTPHRVVNRSGKQRYSIPFFATPDYGAPIAALPTCLQPGEAPIHEPFLAGDYMMKTYRRIWPMGRQSAA